jgi:hypothetical protein
MSKFRENIKGGRADPLSAIKLMQSGLIELAHREIQKGVGDGKYTSAHIQKGYIEFRSPGGDWLAEESADPEKLTSTMLRFARAMSLAANPAEERREYAKKLYKLVAPEGDSELALFSQYAAGELTAEQLKKRWAEKTIGTEKKMNQRWRLYQNVDGRWEPVPGAEWNGYPEDEVKMRVWAKYGREALDTGEYQLVNMGEQDWEVYDVNTGETLEIVKGKSKGEVADQVFDKYVDQGIGFQVRPYADPATMTPRAKLAKRIATKKPEPKQVANQATNERGVPYWEVYEIETEHVVHTFLADTAADAKVDGSNWLESIGAEYPDLFAVRPKIKTAQARDVEPNVAQNFGDDPMAAYERNSDRINAIRQDATNRVGSWSIYDITLGREISRMDNVAWSQADARANELERSTGHNMSVRGLQENFADNLSETLPAKNLNQLYTIKKQLANPAFSTAEPAPAAKPVPAQPAQPRVHTALADLQRQRDKVQQLMNLKQEIETLTARAGRTRYGLTPGLAADIEDIYPNPATEKDMDAAIQGYEVQKKKLADYIARQRKVFPKEDVAEGLYDANPATYDLPRRQLNVPELIKRGAIFVVDPHGENGWEPDAEGFSLVTLYNVAKGGWPAEARQHLKPSMYKAAESGLNRQGPGSMLYDGKYRQILWSIKKLGIPDNVAFLDQAVAENFAEDKKQKPVVINTNPDWFGATIDKPIISKLPVTTVPFNQLEMWEKAKNLNDPKIANWVNQTLLPELKKTGKLKPLTIMMGKGKYLVIDGNHRYLAYQAAGFKNQPVPVQLVPKDMIEYSTEKPADINENFADGKGPGRPGDSQRHGIPKGATIAQLEKAAHAKGRKGQLARWQLNMRRGKAKAK